MLVEASALFVAPSTLQVLSRLGPAMSEPVGRSLLLGFKPFRPLALDPKVDDIGHKSMPLQGLTPPLTLYA